MTKVNFSCKLFGVKVYDKDFPNDQELAPGGWSYVIPFDVPGVAPRTEYDVKVEAVGANGSLFTIVTSFRF